MFLKLFILKNAKHKAIKKHKLPSNLSGNLRSKKPCDQSSVKASCKSLPVKKGKLNMTPSAVVRSVGSISVAVLSFFFFWKI